MPVGFSSDDAKRVAAVVRRVEDMSRGGTGGRGRTSTPWNPGSMVAKNGGSTIAALSSSTPGSGTVTGYTFNGSTVASSDTVTAYNMGSATVAANAWLILSYVGGYWFIVAEMCP